MRFCCLLFVTFCLLAGASPGTQAAASDGYRQALALAAVGRDAEAVAMLRGLTEAAPAIWQERSLVAARLIAMRMQRDTRPLEVDSLNGVLLLKYQQQYPGPEASSPRLTGILATIFPGAGHAWLGRWHDAGIAALMVWPLLLLTLWAGKRRMGPVTVFFALLTLWLWSGSVFSAVSLSERGAFEAYVVWWQGLWQASGLPGRPW